MFKELKEKEGVESIDDVLKKVISPNGISFNEIKPVYRELLLKLAMTMSQDELFQRSKNIMSLKKTTQEKKKNKAKGQKSTNSNNKKNNNSNKYPVSASEHSTLSSFLKLNFSSSKQNKNNNAAENNNNNSNNTTAATNTKVAYADSSKITKRDISGPMPIHPPPSLGKKTPKTTRKATSPLPPTPSPPGSSGSSSGNPHRHHQAHHRNIPTRNGNVPAAPPTKKPPSPPQDDDAYYSCSECGYESVCTYDTCSCSHSPTSNGSSSGHSNNNKSIPPPKAYQTEKLNIIPPNSAKKSHNHHHLGKNSDDVESVVHDCDTESCISEEKCYCSLRGDPRQPANHTMSRYVAISCLACALPAS